ncbi:hypothetical protein [Massilia eburnea]|uniref:hypothetical protein n=1 Tax=Massilia eburnea TaxID=1776165 RepID=UPI003D6A8445
MMMRVLVVDDERLARKELRRLLAGHLHLEESSGKRPALPTALRKPPLWRRT